MYSSVVSWAAWIVRYLAGGSEMRATSGPDDLGTGHSSHRPANERISPWSPACGAGGLLRALGLMKRLQVLATALAFVVLGSGCKKLLKGRNDRATTADNGSSTSAGEIPKVLGTTFTKKTLPIGTKRTEDARSNVNMIFSLLGKVNNVTVTESATKNEEILEVTNDAISKLKVTFAEDAKSTAEPGKPPKVKASVIAGKTYVVSASNGKVTVLDGKGKPPPKAETALVEKRYRSLGKPDQFAVGMPARALRDGEDVPELSEALGTQVKGNDDKMTLEAVKISFRNRQGDSGIFDVSMTIKTGETGLKMTIPLKGTIAVRTTDASPTAMDLTGPLAFEIGGNERKPGITGNGVLKLTSNFSYR